MSVVLFSKIGIFLTFMGFMFTIFEFIKPYKGFKYNDERDPLVYGIDPSIDGATRVETNEYIEWKRTKRKLILVGGFITGVGVILQVI